LLFASPFSLDCLSFYLQHTVPQSSKTCASHVRSPEKAGGDEVTCPCRHGPTRRAVLRRADALETEPATNPRPTMLLWTRPKAHMGQPHAPTTTKPLAKKSMT
jgi:hypothetical protein